MSALIFIKCLIKDLLVICRKGFLFRFHSKIHLKTVLLRHWDTALVQGIGHHDAGEVACFNWIISVPSHLLWFLRIQHLYYGEVRIDSFI